jgi:hypothetical protein
MKFDTTWAIKVYSKLFIRRRQRIPSVAEENASLIPVPDKKVLLRKQKLRQKLNPTGREFRLLDMC